MSSNNILSALTSSSTIRMSGLATGIDTDAVIKQLMQANKVKVYKLQQNKQILKWQQEDYREANNILRSLKDIAFTMKLQSTFLAKTASSSNETAFLAVSQSNAPNGTFSVTVNQLADGASKGSQAALPDAKNLDGTYKTLADQFSLTGSISFTLEGSNSSKTFNFDTSSANIGSIVSEINAANLGLSASYDYSLNRFILNTTSTGSSAKIVVTGDDSNFLSSSAGDGSNNLNLMLKGDGTVYNGNDAMLDFGDMQNITSSSNTVTVNGVTLQLKQGGGSIGTVTVAPNSEAVFNSIKDFVNNYNDAIDKINKKVAERRYTDYPPLIDEQKNAMGEEEIKKWESLARSGLLRNDMLLRGIVNKMRTSMHTSFAGTTGANNLSALGITTGSYVEKGKLQINETKLKEAIQKDPTGVMDLFTRASDNSNEKGIAARIYDDLNSTITLIASKAGNEYSLSSVDNSVIGRRMTEIDSEIESWHDRLDRVESRYIAQFTALEKAIGTLNSQSSWLAQMLGSK